MKKNADIRCLVSPAPVTIVSCGDYEGQSNLTTCSWAGNVNSEPPMAYVCVRAERFSHDIIENSGEFVLNIVSSSLIKEADLCGMYSGRNCDKWELAKLTKGKATAVKAPIVEECPISIECKVKQIVRLPSHDMFIGDVVAIDADESLFDEYGRVRLQNADILSWVNKMYIPLAKNKLNDMGFTVRRVSSGSNRRKSSKMSSSSEEK